MQYYKSLQDVFLGKSVSKWQMLFAKNGFVVTDLFHEQKKYGTALRLGKFNLAMLINESLSVSDMVGAIDYQIKDNTLCIQYLNADVDTDMNTIINTSNYAENKSIASYLVKVAENEAKKQNACIGTIELHQSKRREKIFNYLGYNYVYDLNGKHTRASDNNYWLIMNKQLC